jgi:hypothetical protein
VRARYGLRDLTFAGLYLETTSATFCCGAMLEAMLQFAIVSYLNMTQFTNALKISREFSKFWRSPGCTMTIRGIILA